MLQRRDFEKKVRNNFIAIYSESILFILKGNIIRQFRISSLIHLKTLILVIMNCAM